jgi:hypothetical protein
MLIMSASTTQMKMRDINAVSNLLIGTLSRISSVSGSWQCVIPVTVIWISHFVQVLVYKSQVLLF